jgi:hypothetical protein
MKKRLIAVLLVAAAIAATVVASLAGGASGATTAEAAPQSESPPTMPQIEQAALRAAGRSGELAPSAIEETSGTLGQAAQVLDPHDAGISITDPRTGKPWSDSPVYVVTMRGQFTFDGPTPKNRPAPTGTVLTIVVDAKSGIGVAESLNDSPPDMQQINPSVTTLRGG